MKAKKQYKQTSYRLPTEIKDTLEALAEEMDIPEIAVVRKAIRLLAEQHNQQKQAQAS